MKENGRPNTGSGVDIKDNSSILSLKIECVGSGSLRQRVTVLHEILIYGNKSK